MSIELVGSEKAKKWAYSVIDSFTRTYPGMALPEIASPDFWIKNRSSTLDELLEKAKGVISTPFTSRYPRHGREDAIAALRQITDFLIIDTETTGIAKHSEVCELAIVDFQSGATLFNSLLKPRNIPGNYETSEARKKNGISILELVVSKPLPEYWGEIETILLSKHLTSFNTDFDLKMIRNSAYLWDIPAPALSATCLMKLVTAFLELDYYINLDEAALYFGVENQERHRALGDALATRDIIIAMKGELE